MTLYEQLLEEYGPGPFPDYHVWGECVDGAKSCLIHEEVILRKKPLTLDRWVGG